MTFQESETIELKKSTSEIRGFCKEAKLTDISAKKVKSFLKNSGLKYDTLLNALEKLKLIVDGKLLNATVILFAKKPQEFIPNARLRCAVFGTTDTTFTIEVCRILKEIFFI